MRTRRRRWREEEEGERKTARRWANDEKVRVGIGRREELRSLCEW